ncbi:hypothetical protein L195_g040447 [Trifolium pratense]|uniref:Uncharacterized protein n=1 Tax=Trifolium pratense TaxID=57577 RepID=A0A2K3M0S3_TRIPR|nr:hypothetical protein L195_g040447 [Trifolium pratense]
MQRRIDAIAQELEMTQDMDTTRVLDLIRENEEVIGTMIDSSGEINHSPEIAAGDSQRIKAQDFVLVLALIANDLLLPRDFQGQSIPKESLIALDDSHHLPSRTEEQEACYKGVSDT